MDYLKRVSELGEILSIEVKRKRLAEIEGEMNSPEFWLDEKKSAILPKEMKALKDEIEKYDELRELIEISSPEESSVFEKELEDLERLTLFSGSYDQKNAIVNFFAGAGGVDAQDWTEMLLRMYLRWAEQNDLSAKILNQSAGAEAGIKSASLEFRGSYAYGKLRGESGVHRLVRQSPFNAKALRQTSFALVEVLPEIENAKDVEIDPQDLKVDVYRSGGAGGQSVNTTDSAVRVTHVPTGIVVTCQNERSQLQNKETALTILRSKLVKLMHDQQKEKIEELRGNFSAPEWGNQIRSYVLHPYKMVKDHRTDYESHNPDQVLSGDLNDFIDAELKQGIGK